MKKHVFLKLAFLLTAFLFVTSSFADYKMSVWSNSYDGTGELSFPSSSGTERTILFTIPNYSGNPSDYNFWVGNGGWEDGKSSNVSLSSYVSSCASGVFSLSIWTDSGDSNYYPHGGLCISADPCPASIEAPGSAIPAGTTILFDNAKTGFESVYLSVPTESVNGTSSSISPGDYTPQNDDFYPMTPVGGSIWSATITNASSFGRMSFWNKDLSSESEVDNAKLVFQAPYSTSTNLMVSTEVHCNDILAGSDVYAGDWSYLSTDLLIYADLNHYDDGDNIDINFTALSSLTGDVTWEQSTDNGLNWTFLGTTAEAAESNFVLSGANLPQSTTLYRTSQSGVFSNVWEIVVQSFCGSETIGRNVFKLNFDRGEDGSEPLMLELQGAGSRRPFTSTSFTAYSFKDYPNKVNDADYAIVTTPYYCGCGEGGDDDLESCIASGTNPWYRDIKDVTIGDLGNPINGYGGMLFVNCDDPDASGESIIYERVLTPSETATFAPGSSLTFSSWFANAAKPSSTVRIDMVIRIQYSDDGGTTWSQDGDPNFSELAVEDLAYDQEWVQAQTELNLGTFDLATGQFRIQIANKGNSGTGNDVLIDAISLDLCQPKFSLAFYDLAGIASTSEIIDSTTQELTVKVKNENFGGIPNPCIQLYQFLAPDTYIYVGDMVVDVLDEFYELNIDPSTLLTTIPSTIELQALASPSPCDPLVQQGVEDGTIRPGLSPTNVFSDNMINYSISCKTTGLVLDSYDDICANVDPWPIIRLSTEYSTSIDSVRFTLKANGTVIGSPDQLFVETSTGSGEMAIDLATFDPAFTTVIGDYTFSADVYEIYQANPVCPRTATASQSLEVIDCQQLVLSQTISSPKSCRFDEVTFTVSVVNNAPITANNLAITLAPYPAGLSFVSATGTFDELTRTWTIGDILAAEEMNFDITYQVAELPAGTELLNQVYVSTVNLLNWVSYDDQTNIQLKSSSPAVTLNDVSDTPQVETYESCAENTTISLDDLVTSDQTALQWFDNLGNTIPNTFDISTPGVYSVSVSNTETDECASDTVPTTITIKDYSVAPVVVDYNECPTPGTKALADLVTSDKTYLQWYDESDVLIVSPLFDTSAPGINIYKVSNTQAGLCESNKTSVTVTIKNYSVKPTVEDYNECPIVGDKLLSDLVTSDKTDLKWYGLDAVPLTITSFDTEVPATYAYLVSNTATGECESETTRVNIIVKEVARASDINIDPVSVCPNEQAILTASSTTVQPNPIFKWYASSSLTTPLYTGATFTTDEILLPTSYFVSVENDAYCENLANTGAEANVQLKSDFTNVSLLPKEESIVLGAPTTKTLIVDPSGTAYSQVWTANGEAFDPATFPSKPYKDVVYNVTIRTDCNAAMIEAETEVLWPTAITPYNADGKNDTFVTDMDDHLPIVVFNRYGGKVFEGPNGWDGTYKGDLAQPGVYYYVVTLPDGDVKKGTVEVYKD